MAQYPALEHYNIKILLALNESIKGRKDFFEWLLNNGYAELAAFSNAIRGDKKAMEWLFQHHYPQFAILSNAIDGEDEARVWIGKACHIVNLMFAMACREDERALKWLSEKKLSIFLNMAHEVNIILDTQAAENAGPYVMHF